MSPNKLAILCCGALVVLASAASAVCPASTACVSYAYDAESRTCLMTINTGASCNDGNACTYGDTCDSTGACVGTTITCTPQAGRATRRAVAVTLRPRIPASSCSLGWRSCLPIRSFRRTSPRRVGSAPSPALRPPKEAPQPTASPSWYRPDAPACSRTSPSRTAAEMATASRESVGRSRVRGPSIGARGPSSRKVAIAECCATLPPTTIFSIGSASMASVWSGQLMQLTGSQAPCIGLRSISSIGSR